MEYVRVCRGLNDKGKLIPFKDDVYSHITQDDNDYYQSLYIYNSAHYSQFEAKGTISGIKDVTTDRLVWDFDSEDDVEIAREDTKELVSRLLARGITGDCISICFSGNKGFAVELYTEKRFTPEEFRSINLSLADGLDTNDTKITNASRLFRIPTTKHQSSGLFKMPLTMHQLCELSVSSIRELAQDLSSLNDVPDHVTNPTRITNLPDSIYDLRIPSKKSKIAKKTKLDASLLDFKSKPKNMANCKFAIMNGYFDKGTRSNAMTALAATLKYMGYPKEITYNMCKGAARLQAARTGGDVFTKQEIYSTIINQVFGENWNGGQYSCKTTDWLSDICESLGQHKCRHSEEQFMTSDAVFEVFRSYATNIEQNTILTGLHALDEKVRITTSMLVGILGAPASGKTSLALNILEHTSTAGIDSLMMSLDMAAPILYQKIGHKVTGFGADKIYHIIKENGPEALEFSSKIREKFKHVRFSFRSGWSVEDIRNAILDHQATIEKKLKFVLIDYAECLVGSYSDATANSAQNASALKDLANDLDICIVLLVQPQKAAGDASTPLISMRSVKGSSMLEQAFSVLLGIYRDGFSPTNPEDDRFMTINCLKNRMGNVFTLPFSWEGLRGEIGPISERELVEYRKIKDFRAEQRKLAFGGNPF